MFDIFITEPATVLADSEPDPMPTRLVISTMILSVESLDRGTAFYADGHFISE
jgi:hypothetical protein